jgi:hypothetical protein
MAMLDPIHQIAFPCRIAAASDEPGQYETALQKVNLRRRRRHHCSADSRLHNRRRYLGSTQKRTHCSASRKMQMAMLEPVFRNCISMPNRSQTCTQCSASREPCNVVRQGTNTASMPRLQPQVQSQVSLRLNERRSTRFVAEGIQALRIADCIIVADSIGGAAARGAFRALQVGKIKCL